MLSKIGELFSTFTAKLVTAIPLLSNFISVKIAADDNEAIRFAVLQVREFCTKGVAFCDMADKMLADNKLELTEIQALMQEMKKLADEAEDIVTAVKAAV